MNALSVSREMPTIIPHHEIEEPVVSDQPVEGLSQQIRTRNGRAMKRGFEKATLRKT